MPLMISVQRQDLWNQNTLRTTHPGTPHTEVDDIWLRFNDLKEPENVMDQHESINYPAFAVLPQARPLVFGVMNRVDGERLGRVLITRLSPGKKIALHVDGGAHAAYYDRFHVVLQASPGSLFRSGNETVQMMPGDVWWFDNAQEHEVINNGIDDRIHMIVDVRTSWLPIK